MKETCNVVTHFKDAAADSQRTTNV